MQYDLLIRNARFHRHQGLYDIAVKDNIFVCITEDLSSAHALREIDAAERLVVPPFIDAHVHLDAVLTVGQPRYNNTGTLLEGIQIWSERKPSLTHEDVRRRALEEIQWEVAQGTLHIRSHVDVCDPELTALRALLEIREEVRDICDLQLVAFPQDGILSFPNGKDLMRKTMEQGCDIVGGILHYEATRDMGVEDVHYAFALAKEFDCDIDCHCDETDDPHSRFTEVMAADTLEQGWQGRVTASHCTAMHSYDNTYAFKLIRLLARAQVNIIANPFDNVVLQGRFDSYPKRRGITRVKELLAAGVNVALGHDSIMAPWFPLGRGDMLAAAQLALLLCHIILATRADPPLPLPLLRSHKQVLEVRADQLRCTPEETKAFFDQVMGIQLPDEIIQEVTARMEGWLVGLQLLGLSLPERTNPLTLLQEASGDQHYILDFLTQEVLGQQPQEIQTFLLYTSILEQLNTSLCDAVMQQHGSQQMLHRLEQTNLFVVSLDNKRQWYRYHALFAEALRNRLEQTHPDVVLALHYRASLWYTKHDRTTQAILHAFRAQEWQWAADLIEQKSLQVSVFTWGAGEHELALLRQWIEQLPLDVMKLRPHLCITCIRLFALVAPLTVLKTWLEIVEAALTASLTKQIQEDDPMSDPKVKQKLQNQLGEVIAHRAFLLSYDEHGEAALPLCQQALSLLSTGPSYSHVTINWAQLYAYYYSTNDTEAAIQSGLQGVSLTQALGHSGVAITAMCAAARHMKEAGYLHEAQQLIQQATQLGTQLGGLLTPEAGHPTVWQAELLREWNQLDAAHSFIDEAISLCKQSKTPTALMYILFGYAVLLRVSLSSGKLKMAHTALREFEHIGKSMNQPSYLYLRSFYTTIDQIKLWLACGELDRATRWAEELDRRERRGTPFAHEREEVALARILLAKSQPELALQRLEPVLQRATIGKRWSHVIEIRLLQALAHQMLKQEGQALDALSQATLLAEPEGYIRSFVDEGAQIEALLYRMRKRDCRNGPTPYLDTLLTAFQQERKGPAQVEEESIKMQPIAEPLSGRELEVLHLLVRGASNQEIAQELVIVIDTVKRHISHIFSKLGVKNRVQAIRQAQALGILSEKL